MLSKNTWLGAGQLTTLRTVSQMCLEPVWKMKWQLLSGVRRGKEEAPRLKASLRLEEWSILTFRHHHDMLVCILKE